MEYNKLISVTGLSGLFELVASKTDGAIVRSLEEKTTTFVSSRNHNFSHLESIEVYTKRQNVNLIEVLTAMKNSDEPLPSDKNASDVKKYFEKVYPELDFERVYASDMKKMVRWFAIIQANDIELKLPEQSELGEADKSPIIQSEKPTAQSSKIANSKSKANKVQAQEKWLNSEFFC